MATPPRRSPTGRFQSSATTGSYTGDGVANRLINVGFRPKVLFVEASPNQFGALSRYTKTDQHPGSTYSAMRAVAPVGPINVFAGSSLTFTARGFQIEAAALADLNTLGNGYTWIAF